jgi:hypothetical protein
MDPHRRITIDFMAGASRARGGAGRSLGAVLVVIAAAVAAPAAQAKKLTFKVTSVSVAIKPTDRPPKGTSKGDTIAYRDRLVNAAAQFGRAKGAAVGTDRGTMRFTGPHAATFSGIATLPGGTLTLKGRVVPVSSTTFAIPVTDGTGRFAKARGYVIVGPGTTRSLNVYSLTLPSTPVA